MPLRDHFQPPLAPARKSGSFHSAWASTITQQLNAVLPEDYYAEPDVQLGNQFEIDVATLQKDGQAAAGGSAIATALWAPPRPTQTIAVDFLQWEVFEIRVYQDLGGPQLRAAIELICPANKDRPSHRQAFAIKCGSHLQHAVSVVIVDIVTERLANLHAEILQILELKEESAWQSPTNLYTVAYRTVLSDAKHYLEIWTEPLALSGKLPTMPLWLDIDSCLPLHLEESYLATCQALRIRL
jgi:hypothetical protein